MAQNSREFPNVGNKLSAPNKKSVFERQKAEAEAKRLKEQEETAAVYADFVKSFDNEDDDGDDGAGGVFASGPGRASQGSGRLQTPGGPGKRHFTGPIGKPGFGGGPKVSGPGSLGPPPSAFSRKRTYDGTPARDAGARTGRYGFDEPESRPSPAFGDSDDDETKDVKMKDAERAASKPTVHLTSLPLVLSPTAIKALFSASLGVESVRMLPTQAPGSTDRKSASAIVTLATDTPGSEIDSAISALQNRYLGYGFYLNLSRHLSSAAVGGSTAIPGVTGSGGLPFGAKTAPQGPAPSLSRAPPPPGMGRGFAPPASLGGFGRRTAPAQVEVKPPSDLKQLKLIHKTVESVISHGPEFEALLMSRPSVQKDERWAWLWDPRSQGGVWYRWRLWDILTSAQQRIRKGNGKNDNSTQIVFLGGAPWASQERALAFEYDNNLAEFVSGSEYDSSEDEDSGDEGRRRLHHLQGGTLPNDQAEPELPVYLNPLQKAKLVHLLARLPTSTARLRRGDIARVTAFAIKYASEGADEVVDLITRNIHVPFSLTSANPEHKKSLEPQSRTDSEEEAEKDRDKDIDISSIKLVALYVISDILSSSSTSGVRHAWRYRQLFESALRNQGTFAHLGRLEKELGWGRMRAEKFKRSVNNLLGLWEGWCVFPAPAQEEFGKIFNDPPMTEKEKIEAKQKEAEEETERVKRAASNKWKTVDEGQAMAEAFRLGAERDGDVVMEDDLDGEPMVDDEDVDGVPMEEDEDVDGEPMVEDDEKPEETGAAKETVQQNKASEELRKSTMEPTPDRGPDAARTARMRRPKAEDMFADSDEE